MIDFKKTIINLHKTFPDKDLDELMKIIECIECIEEQIPILTNPLPGNPIPREPYKDPFGPPWTTSLDIPNRSSKVTYKK